MKTIILNFISLFRRFSVATWLNIAGLSIAFTAFIILMMQVSYDWGYDRFHKNADRLYRVETIFSSGEKISVLSRPMIETFIISSPHIEAGTYINQWDNKRNIAIERDQQRIGFLESYLKVSPTFSEIFNFNIIEGDIHTLSSSDKVLIPESMANRLFPNSSAIGKYLDSDELKAEIGGIYKDFPENSIIKNTIYQQIPENEDAGIWNYRNFEACILLDNPQNIDLVLDNFRANFRHDSFDWDKYDLRLTKLPDIYYTTDITFDSQTTKGNRIQIFVLFCIALLIIFIAAINFVNFSNALIPARIRNINTQKILGCSVNSLRLSMIVEAVIICFMSFLIAIVLLLFLQETVFSDIVSGGISISSHSGLIIGTGVFAIIIAILSGCWPAVQITSYPPALVLKGNFGLSGKGRNIRNVLVSMQYSFSFILIISALFINLQNRYMLRSSLGFDQEQIAVIKINKKLGNNKELLYQQLKNIPEIIEVTTVDRIPGEGDVYSKSGGKYKDEQKSFDLIHADISILKVLGIKVTEGRDFLSEDLTGNGAYIFSEKARKELNLEIGDSFDNGEKIVGVINDLKYNSYRNETSPFGFYTKHGFRNYALVRFHANANFKTLSESIQKALTTIDPDYPMDISLYDKVIDNLYQKEIILGRQIFLFSGIAILISLIGILGIVFFESEYKRREIGIRKVFGSTVNETLLLLSNRYVRMLIICFILSMPVIWYAVSKWLESFVYKTPLYGWVFILSFVLVSFLTLLTVTIQNWRAATANPIDSIKTE